MVARIELQAGDLELLEPVGLRGRDLAREVDEAGVALRELLDEVVLGQPQDRGDLRRRPDGVLDQVGRGGDVGRGLGDRERDAVAIDDRAAPRRHDGRADLLRDRRGRELAALEDADLDRPQGGRGEQGKKGGEEQADPAIDEPRAHCVAGVVVVGVAVAAAVTDGVVVVGVVVVRSRGGGRRRRRARRLLLLRHRRLLRRRRVGLLLALLREHRLRTLLRAARVGRGDRPRRAGAVARRPGGQEPQLAVVGHHHAARRRDVLDALAAVEARDARAQLGVVALEALRREHVGADAGVELEQRDLHEDEHHQRARDQADPQAPANQAVEHARVGHAHARSAPARRTSRSTACSWRAAPDPTRLRGIGRPPRSVAARVVIASSRRASARSPNVGCARPRRRSAKSRDG